MMRLVNEEMCWNDGMLLYASGYYVFGQENYLLQQEVKGPVFEYRASIVLICYGSIECA